MSEDDVSRQLAELDPKDLEILTEFLGTPEPRWSPTSSAHAGRQVDATIDTPAE